MFALREGLEFGPKISVSKGRELAEARDGFLLIKNRVVELLRKHGVSGYDTRSIPNTEWHVFRVTYRVPFKEFTPQRSKLPCGVCGRGAYYGSVTRLRDVELPGSDNTFFAPEQERTNAYDVFLTERVAQMLKSEAVKGGLLVRFLDDEEHAIVKGEPSPARRKVKDQHIFLT